MTSAASSSTSTEAAWQDIRRLVGMRALKDLADRVLALTDDERADAADRLPGLLDEARRTTTSRAEPPAPESPASEVGVSGLGQAGVDADWMRGLGVRMGVSDSDRVGGFGEALRVVGAGTLPGPAAVAAWLGRREFVPRWGTPPHPAEVICVLAARPVAFQADVAARVARKIRTADDRLAPLALALLRAFGGTPLDHDPLVTAWLAAWPVRPDPLLVPLLPRVFEAEGVGRVLRGERLDPVPTPWLALIKRLLNAGRVSREELADGCVRRFLRGGDPADLRFFVRLHELAGPTREEVAVWSRDYLRLLPAAPGPVAELALTQVRRTGPHDDGDVSEAIAALTFRPEAGLARAGLRWLEEEVRRAPARAADLAPALATASGHDSYEVRRRAARIAARHATAFTPAADVLSIEVLGTEVAATEVPVPDPLPVFEPFPEPGFGMGRDGWVGGERWLAALVAGMAGDREAVRAEVAAEFDGTYTQLYDHDRWVGADFWIAALAKEVLRPGGDPVAEPRLPEPRHVSPPHLFLLRRLSEVYQALRAGTLPPVLLATPTALNGHLDPEVLVDRLETTVAMGAEPLSADLCQALLRLPRGGHPGAAARAARLGRPAAVVAAWLDEGGPADPETGVRWSYIEDDTEHLFDEREPVRLTSQVRLVPVLRARPTGHVLIDELLAEPSRWRWNDHGRAMDWWAATLPSHREVVAVNHLPHLVHLWNHPGVQVSHFAELADADGPPGEAFALVVACFVAGGDVRALPVVLRMAARGELPGEAVGRQLALLVRRASFQVRPILRALGELAGQGADEPVWRMLTGLLPGLLPGPGERPTVTHSDAVALAADVAGRVGARGAIPVVSAHAASGRDTRFVRECGRLRDLLG
ncbi:hypothetical protein ACIBIZ_09845 [Nonomuraea spiralis]|uniref:hypothetical protein n=1 Tax=Nonomuraea spiralis TaxID=46182 RepID=UPI0037908EC3